MGFGKLLTRADAADRVVEIFNNPQGNEAVATVNFSVPDEVKAAFNKTFAGRNKSAVIAALMREAVERVRRGRESRETVERILRRRARGVSRDELRSIRDDGRP